MLQEEKNKKSVSNYCSTTGMVFLAIFFGMLFFANIKNAMADATFSCTGSAVQWTAPIGETVTISMSGGGGGGGGDDGNWDGGNDGTGGQVINNANFQALGGTYVINVGCGGNGGSGDSDDNGDGSGGGAVFGNGYGASGTNASTDQDGGGGGGGGRTTIALLANAASCTGSVSTGCLAAVSGGSGGNGADAVGGGNGTGGPGASPNITAGLSNASPSQNNNQGSGGYNGDSSDGSGYPGGNGFVTLIYAAAPVNGACATNSGTIATLAAVNQCTPTGGTPTVPLSSFTASATPTQTIQWGCNGSGGGTSTSSTACSATVDTYTITPSPNPPTNGTTISCTSPVFGGASSSCSNIFPSTGFYLSSLMDGSNNATSNVSGGVYSLSNIMANHSIVATFSAQTIPGAPTIGTAAAGNASVVVNFSAPSNNGGATITGYNATCTSSNGGATGSQSGAGSPLTVASLTNGDLYTCTVTATNSVGTGATSSASNSVTPVTPLTVPSAPTAATAVVASATSATITFTAPASNGGATITTYTATSSPGAKTGTCTGPSACTITVIGLTTNTAYTFTVIATNSVGPGAASSASNSVTPITLTVPGAPTIGTATAVNAAAIVTFSPPASNGGATITGYTATSTPGSVTGACSASPCVVFGLTGGTAYTFAITATNSQGVGSPSSASNSVTPTLYTSSSTYTSTYIQISQTDLGFGTLTYTSTVGANNALSMYVRSCASNTPGACDIEHPWGTCVVAGTLATGANLSATPGNTCMTAGDTYVQYRVFMGTTDNATVPSFGPVTISNQTGYSKAWQTLVSSPFDSSNAYTAIGNLTWVGGGKTGSGDPVEFQIRTAPDSTSLQTAQWCGPTKCNATMGDGTAGTGNIYDYYVTNTGVGTNSAQANTLHTTNTSRWIQYVTFMHATDGTNATLPNPVTNVTIPFSYNSPPTVTAPAINQITSGANASQVQATYNLSDVDVTSSDAPSTNDYQMLLYQPKGIVLSSAIDSGTVNGNGTSLTLSNPSNQPYPTSGYVMIDNELIKYAGATGTNPITLSGITRAVAFDNPASTSNYPTLAAAHLASAPVFFRATAITTYSSGATAIAPLVTTTPTQYSIIWNAQSEPNITLSGSSVVPWTNWNFEVAAADGNYGTDAAASLATTLAALDLQPPSITSAVAGGSGKTLADNAFINSNVVNLKMSEPFSYLTSSSLPLPLASQYAQVSFTPTAGGSAITNTLTTGNCSAISTSAQPLTIPGLTTNTTYNVSIQGLDLFGNAFAQPHSGTTTYNNVTYDTTPPTITSISAVNPNQSYSLGAKVPIQLNMSEPISNINSMVVTLQAGNNTEMCTIMPISVGSETQTPTCNYTVLAGDDTQKLYATAISNTSTILDKAGNAFVQNFSGILSSSATNLSQSNIIIDTKNQERIKGTVGINGRVKFQ